LLLADVGLLSSGGMAALAKRPKREDPRREDSRREDSRTVSEAA
jgi:hypothetical protein